MSNTKLLTERDMLIANLQTEVARLHRTGSSDYQMLTRQAKKAIKPLEYNVAQLVSRMNWENPKYQLIYDRWARGTGKTTGIGGKLTYIAENMPRSTWTFISPSYKFLLTRIIPSIINGLDLHGYIQGLHYFIGEKPPRSWNWTMPYGAPKDFSKFMVIYNPRGCMGIHFISQDVPGDGRGLNTDGELGDESAYLDFSIMEECTTPTLRGSRAREFKDNPLFLKRFHHSSMPISQTGGWIFDLEAKNAQGEDAALIIDATCKVNLKNLAPNYLENAQKTAISQVIFEAEYLNIRPPVSGIDGFYPLFSEKTHGYRPQDNLQYAKRTDCMADTDLRSGVPLLLGMDFGSAINFVVVGQHLRSENELRILNNFYVTSQEGKFQDHVIQAFHNYYAPHQGSCKEVFFFYDKTGNVETGNTPYMRADQAVAQLSKLGWRVIKMTFGRKNIDHSTKFTLWQKILQNSPQLIVVPNLPHFKINVLRCRTLIVSMHNSKAKEGQKNTIKKDKSIEKKLTDKQQRQNATDGSDALDMIVEGLFADMTRFGGGDLPL
jgi:hypothetical protein